MISRAFLLGGAIILTAWAVGLLTNGINATVSVDYFELVLRARMSFEIILLQGLLESFVFGIVAAWAIVPLYCGLTGCRSSLRPFWGTLGWVVAIGVGGHLLGGLMGCGLAMTDPAIFQQLFPVSRSAENLRTFAYVGGAIWGVYLGGVSGFILMVRVNRLRLGAVE